MKNKERIEELEKTFSHYHVQKHDGTDICLKCGLDLRDSIHKTITKPRKIKYIKPTELEKKHGYW